MTIWVRFRLGQVKGHLLGVGFNGKLMKCRGAKIFASKESSKVIFILFLSLLSLIKKWERRFNFESRQMNNF